MCLGNVKVWYGVISGLYQLGGDSRCVVTNGGDISCEVMSGDWWWW